MLDDIVCGCDSGTERQQKRAAIAAETQPLTEAKASSWAAAPELLESWQEQDE